MFGMTAALGDEWPCEGTLLTFPDPELNERAKSATAAAYTVDGPLTTGQTLTFTVTEELDGAAEFTLAYVPDWTTDYQALLNSSSASFAYHLYMPGKYRIFIRSRTGSVIGYTRVITVTGNDLLAAKVSELAAGCTASDDYGKALWVHEYLTQNTYYDIGTAWHGADYLLFEGYGTCQSYSEAYRKLVMALGLSCDIVQSSAMSHEWVNVQVNGSWYPTDVTWDTKASGYPGKGKPSTENDHVYFLISDELMNENHRSYQAAHTCDTVADNYYIHTGDADRWLPTGEALALAQLQAGRTEFVITLPNLKSIDDRVDIKAADVAYLLNGATLRGEHARYIIAAEHVPSSYGYKSPEIRITVQQVIPITGDDTPVLLLALLGLGACAALLFLRRTGRRRS